MIHECIGGWQRVPAAVEGFHAAFEREAQASPGTGGRNTLGKAVRGLAVAVCGIVGPYVRHRRMMYEATVCLCRLHAVWLEKRQITGILPGIALLYPAEEFARKDDVSERLASVLPMQDRGDDYATVRTRQLCGQADREIDRYRTQAFGQGTRRCHDHDLFDFDMIGFLAVLAGHGNGSQPEIGRSAFPYLYRIGCSGRFRSGIDAQGPGRMAQDCGNVTAVEPPGNAASARKEQEHGQRGNDNT